MRTSRRRFLRTALAASAGALSSGALEALFARARAQGRASRERPWEATGYGPLISDPAGLLDLPAGFTYRAFSTSSDWAGHDRFGRRLTNGDAVPARHDGMGAFAGAGGVTVLVRNHEVDIGGERPVDPKGLRRYDPMLGGGTTTLWVDSNLEVVRSFASLSGTGRNCAGGTTPWGSWLSCEECTYMPGPRDRVNRDRTPRVSKPHGYVFEVDARAEDLVDPVPLVAMGRFYHEACAVDAETGYVYLSEDRNDGVMYRFRPAVLADGKRKPADLKPGDLARGGVLEALRIRGRSQAKTQNWEKPDAFLPGRAWRVDWVPVPNVNPDMDEERDPRDEEPDPLRRRARTAATSTRAQAFGHGAAQFARVEGITYGAGALWWCCTNGGMAGAGQVWKLDPRRSELTLVVEPDDATRLDGPDNLVVAPNGDLVVCEDGTDDDYVIGITPVGSLYRIARNAINQVEFAGACFSPDGSTMFVNIQEPGITFAVRGPWEKREA